MVRVVQFLHTQGPVASALSYQLLKCGTSAGANYEEADDGTGPGDKAAKRKIVLRELKDEVQTDGSQTLCSIDARSGSGHQ